jgi:hypothetical protein
MDLKSLNWKRHLNTGIKVLMDLKVVGLIALFGFTIYGIGWDTVWRPSMEAMKSRDDAISVQRKMLADKGSVQKQYATLQEQLKNLTTQMIPIPAGNSTTVVAVAVAADLVNLAKGQSRDVTRLPALPAPHNVRENVVMTPMGSKQLDLKKDDGSGNGSSGGSNPGSAPASPSPAPGPGMAQGDPKAAAPGGLSGAQDSAISLPVERFDYEMKVTGTYPALVDFLNELVLYKKMVKISKVQIIRTPAAIAEQPDAKEDPDFPVKLEMTLSLSLFFYNDTAANTGA